MHGDGFDRGGQARRADAARQYHARKAAGFQQRINQHAPALVAPLPGTAEQAFQIVEDEQDRVVFEQLSESGQPVLQGRRAVDDVNHRKAGKLLLHRQREVAQRQLNILVCLRRPIPDEGLKPPGRLMMVCQFDRAGGLPCSGHA
jgi:hypothetical protein